MLRTEGSLRLREGFFVQGLLDFSDTLSDFVFVANELDSHVVEIELFLSGHLLQLCEARLTEHIMILAHLDTLQPVFHSRRVTVFDFG